MTVRDHTYYLAQDDEVFGPRQDLGDFLREQYRSKDSTEVSRIDGASVWWNGDVRHVAVTYRAPEWDRAATVKLEPSA